MKAFIRKFDGEIPKMAGHLLPLNNAQIAQNCDLHTGALMPWNNVSVANDGNPLVDRTTILTMYRLVDTGYSEHWLEFKSDVDIVSGPVSGDTSGRFYYTGDGLPKKSNIAEATTGAGAKPINFWPIGIPHPVAVPAAVVTVSGGTGDDREIAYLWTVVTTWGEESRPSESSAILTAKEGDTVRITNLTLEWDAGAVYEKGDWVVPSVANGYMYRCVIGGSTGAVEPTWGTTVDGDTADNAVTWRCYEYAIAEKRIYRANTGLSSGSWQYAGGIDDAVVYFDDDIADVYLGEVISTIGWNPPPDTLQGLVGMTGGMLAGFDGKDLYFSEPYYPHAWPDYSFPLPADIVGLGVVGTSLVVMTTEHPYLITGSTPESLTPIKLPEQHPCVSKRSIAEGPEGIIYATPSGLYIVTEAGGDFLTKDYFGREEWQAIHPETSNAAVQNSQYFMFYDDGAGDEGGIILNLRSGILTTLDFYASAVYVDKKTDELYFVRSEVEVLLLEDGTSYPARTNAILLENGVDYLLTE